MNEIIPPRIFFIDEIRDLLSMYRNHETSIEKVVEVLNEIATGVDAVDRFKNEVANQGKQKCCEKEDSAWMKSPFWDEEFEKLSNEPKWCPLKDDAIDAFLVELKCRIAAREKEAGSQEKYYSCVFCTWKGPESETRQDVQCPNCNHLESLMPVQPTCCEKAEAEGVQICRECSNTHAGYQSQYLSEFYQPLFDHMSIEHNLNLLESEMDDVIRVVEGMLWIKDRSPEESGSYLISFADCVTIGYFNKDIRAWRHAFSDIIPSAWRALPKAYEV